jgi:hypothetical protein
VTGEKLIEIAKTWVGVPFVHNQASKSIGCDCGGLILGVAREAGLTRIELPRYERGVAPAMLLTYLGRELESVWHEGREMSSVFRLSSANVASAGWANVRTGDVLCLKTAAPKGEAMPRHLAYWTGDRILHTEGRRGEDGKPTGVVETAVDQRLFKRLHSVWRWKTLEKTAGI